MSDDTLVLHPKDTALIFIEFQNEFTTEGGALHDAVKECMQATGTLTHAKKMLEKGRSLGCTIIHCPISFLQGHLEISNTPYGILAPIKNGQLFTANEWASAICEDMKPVQGDLICMGKSGLCGFASTNLDFLLRQNHIKNVVLCGFLTNCCVESTMRSAYEKGFRVYTLKDCCAATSVEAQEAAYQHTFGMFSFPTTSTVRYFCLYRMFHVGACLCFFRVMGFMDDSLCILDFVLGDYCCIVQRYGRSCEII